MLYKIWFLDIIVACIYNFITTFFQFLFTWDETYNKCFHIWVIVYIQKQWEGRDARWLKGIETTVDSTRGRARPRAPRPNTHERRRTRPSSGFRARTHRRNASHLVVGACDVPSRHSSSVCGSLHSFRITRRRVSAIREDTFRSWRYFSFLDDSFANMLEVIYLCATLSDRSRSIRNLRKDSRKER